MKRFASVWLPMFQIDRLRRVSPQSVPRKQPFALVESGARGVSITAINRPAAANDIHAGQMLADARAVFPGLLTGVAEPDRDADALQKLALWLGRYGPNRNVDGVDGLWVDITGVAHLFGGEEALARDCVMRFKRAGFQALVAIADTRSGAFALARYGRMTDQIAIAPPGKMRKALADLPVEGLQLTSDLSILLRRLGLKRIGQLYTLPRAALARRFRDAAPKLAKGRKRRRGLGALATSTSARAGWAEALVMRLDQALGTLSEPARGIVDPPVYRVQRAYADPLISHEGVVAALDDLAERLCTTLDAQDEGARALKFVLFRSDGTVAEIVARTSYPARAADHIVALFHERLDKLDLGLGLDAVVLEALRTELLVREQVGFATSNPASGHRHSTSVLIDRLSNRLSASSVFYLEEVESHIPERAERRVSALSGTPSPSSLSAKPRPAWMFNPAEPITVIAEVPDGPPVRFTWRRVTRRVAYAEGPERIAPEWWRLIGQGEPEAAVSNDAAELDADVTGELGTLVRASKPAWRIRDYYHVEDEYGGLYWIYRAGLYPGIDDDPEMAASVPPSWYLQGVF